MRVAVAGLMLFVAAGASAHAQGDGRDLSVADLGLDVAWAPAARMFGLGVLTEARVPQSSSVSFGLRAGAAFLAGGAFDQGSTTTGVARLAFGFGLLARGEFLIGEAGSAVRPFVAGLVGGHGWSSHSFGGAAPAQHGGLSFGLAPQLGVELGGVRIALTWHQQLRAASAADGPPRNHLTLEFTFRALQLQAPSNVEQRTDVRTPGLSALLEREEVR